MTVPSAAVDAAQKGMMIRSVVNHLKENRIEYAVFTLLLYSIGAIDKAMTYGAGICL